MDVGVGCVVVSMGLTASQSLRGRLPLYELMRSTLPILLLGLLRMLLVKSVGYHVPNPIIHHSNHRIGAH